ncbi:MAG: hypothetical protein HUU29_11695, partial [Planctomycetaceae bacterium]|nr:hypothetical protein [Planctomycetaceae bacterium]
MKTWTSWLLVIVCLCATSALYAQTVSNGTTMSDGIVVGGGRGVATNGTLHSEIFTDGPFGASEVAGGDATNVGKIFSLPGAGTRENVWLGAVSNDPLDGKNWSDGAPIAGNADNIAIIAPSPNSPVLTTGMLSVASLIIRPSAMFSVSGTGIVELGTAAAGGVVIVEDGG